MGDVVQALSMEHLLSSVAPPEQCFYYAHHRGESPSKGFRIGEFFGGDKSKLIKISTPTAWKVTNSVWPFRSEKHVARETGGARCTHRKGSKESSALAPILQTFGAHPSPCGAILSLRHKPEACDWVSSCSTQSAYLKRHVGALLVWLWDVVT